MAKRLHILCNAHLDPVWQWEWEEGAAETLSTFRIAADFCDEYDNFVFCHNEALLYKWIEEYDMPLFERIRALVKAGKWHIMGGWHLQPDCNMPSGEGFVRQIFDGRRYFKEKFGVVPTVAVNLDPFGHTRGLVQIMKKSGYDGYLFMRPGDGDRFIKLPSNEFTWRGYDGSEVTAVRIHGGYNSGKGHAADKIRAYADACPADDFFLCLWGIGNHGGGPSKKDLDDIEVLTAEMAKKNVEIVQSTPEKYFAEVKEKHTLPVWDKSINNWSVGCYTSQVRVKQKYRAAENMLFTTEIMATHAAFGDFVYPASEFAEALYDILTVQFHDMLPGSSVQPAEEMAMRMLDHALEILSRVRARAFFALAAGQPKAPADKIPIFAYNPHPYPVTGDLTAEFMLWDQNWNKEFLQPVLYDEAGNILPSQCEKENSTIPLEWRKRVTFHATLEPMKMNRFECGFKSIPEKPVPTLTHDEYYYTFGSASLTVKINRATGLVDVLNVGGKEYVARGAFGIEVWDDNFDPWYMDRTSWQNKLGRFKLLSSEDAQIVCHTDSYIDAVHVIESGDVRTVVEAVFGYNDSRAVVKYVMSEKAGFRMDIRIVNVEKQKLFKLNVPAAFAADTVIGEHAYGREVLKKGLEEDVAQKYIVLCDENDAVAVCPNGSFGCSFDETASSLKVTLMRSPSYTAHPLPGRVTMPQDRYMPYIEQGERDFALTFAFGATTELLRTVPRKALVTNMPPMVLSFYPTGTGKALPSPAALTGDTVELTAMKKADNGEGTIIRLFNPTEHEAKATFTFLGVSCALTFGAYEIKTLRFADGTLTESDLMEGLLAE